MAQWLKVFASKSDDMSLDPAPSCGKTELTHLKYPLTSTCTLIPTCVKLNEALNKEYTSGPKRKIKNANVLNNIYFKNNIKYLFYY